MDHFYENTDKTPEQILQTLKAREELPPLSVRLATGDENLVRLEITRRVLTEWSETERSNVLHVLNEGLNNSVKCVHLSGEGLGDFYAEAEWETFLSGLCSLPSLEELFIFHGSNPFLGQEYLAKHIVKAKKLRVLMMWGYSKYIPDYCAAVQKLPNLERNTLTLARTMKWSSMDMYCMAMAQLSSLKCLNLRCPHGCKDSIVSPEALAVLLQSKSIESLYMDNCGLIDDHTDVFAAELKENTVLKLLDIKNNLFSDDALFSMASCMPHNSTLTTLDLTGVTITEAGGRKLAKSMEKNSTMLFIELEGYAERCK